MPKKSLTYDKQEIEIVWRTESNISYLRIKDISVVKEMVLQKREEKNEQNI